MLLITQVFLDLVSPYRILLNAIGLLEARQQGAVADLRVPVNVVVCFYLLKKCSASFSMVLIKSCLPLK